MKYQLEGYYVIRLNKCHYAPPPAHQFVTVCTSMNDNLLNYSSWEHPYWLDKETKRASTNIESFFLADLNLPQLKAWVYQKHQEGKVKWSEYFSDLATAYEYRHRFFHRVPGVVILSLSFLKTETQQTLQRLKASGITNPGGFWQQFAKPIKPKFPEKGKVIGYDVIGRQTGCISIHSFLVHGTELFKFLGVRVNQYGLLNDETKWEEIMEFMNDPEILVEPEPWYWAQVKLFE